MTYSAAFGGFVIRLMPSFCVKSMVMSMYLGILSATMRLPQLAKSATV